MQRVPADRYKKKRVRMSGENKFFFNWEQMEVENVGGDYSTAKGPVVRGEQIQVSRVTKARGTGANPHTHPNEQFNYVVKGTLRAMVDGEHKMVGPGEIIYIPAGAVHATVATQDEDVIFLAIKDTRHGMTGQAVDPSAGKYYDEDMKPKGA